MNVFTNPRSPLYSPVSIAPTFANGHPYEQKYHNIGLVDTPYERSTETSRLRQGDYGPRRLHKAGYHVIDPPPDCFEVNYPKVYLSQPSFYS